ncbi:RDD family protein [Oceanobacillus picturae]|uniref:RDD family protein n=2 Tax=Oceanobacillus TaxID=182709 RepID=W9AJK6_9BACI|nr:MULTISPECIES: RDD family protein [Oceanobacillus]MCG3418593.1 RDD family protein [Oceanobacillus jordanicus]CDO02861.1 RDD family protein [Oceanobacillus picturae]
MISNKPAGFWIRFLADFIDGMLILLLATVIAFLIGDDTFWSSWSSTDETTSQSIANFLYGIIFIIIFTGSKFMGSPGKLTCKIKVVNVDGTQISMLKSIGRYLCYFISALPLGIGFMMAGWNEEKKALHDMICKTRVVYRNE